MINYFKSIKCEMYKQIKMLLVSKNAIILMTLYPILEFAILYGRYLPFNTTELVENFETQTGIPYYFSFFLIGYIGLMLFQSVMLTGWFFARERVMGTLELTYMTPANKLGLLTGNAIVGLVKNVWLSMIFALMMAVFMPNSININIFQVILVLPIFIIPAICWGTFVNSLLMFSRNNSLIFTFLSNPLSLFSGTEIPINVIPVWLRPISFVIPLTWSISIIRNILLKGVMYIEFKISLIILVGMCFLLMILANMISKKAVKYLKESGSLTFF